MYVHTHTHTHVAFQIFSATNLIAILIQSKDKKHQFLQAHLNFWMYLYWVNLEKHFFLNEYILDLCLQV